MSKKTSPKLIDQKSQKVEDIYKKKTQHEHILSLPDTYIGSVQSDTINMWIHDDSQELNMKKDITFVPGLYKIYDEILVNASDNTIRDKTCKIIKVTIDQDIGRITVWNDGTGIPVQIHKEYNVYIPELIFGHLLTSSNYDQKGKTVGGKNGIGAKACNIFSTEFVVKTLDTKNKKEYCQKFENNMFKVNPPEIKSIADKSKSYTEISFIPDFKRFGIKGLTNDIINLFKKRVYDVAAYCGAKVKVYLNDKHINIGDFKDYIRTFYPKDSIPSNITYKKFNERWKVGVLYDKEVGFNQVSYVNGICTYLGGTHVDYVTNQIIKKILEHIQVKHKGVNVKSSLIRENLTVFIDCVIEDPAFSSQTKETLTTKSTLFGSECVIDDAFINEFIETGIIEDVVKYAQFRAQEELKKTDGKKVTNVRGIDKLEDALWAGGKKSKYTRLILTEGDSAKAFAMAGLSVIGREKYGVFPLRGKFLNVREATTKQLVNNMEFYNLKQILGLKQNKKYTDVSKLRYGGIIILTDQDFDGSHIKGLLINMFHRYWPSLLKIDGFIQSMATPIIKAWKTSDKNKSNPLIFQTMSEYHNWVNNTMNGVTKGWEIKYYKGLGTSTEKEAKEVFNEYEKNIVNYIWETSDQEDKNNQNDEKEKEVKDTEEVVQEEVAESETDKNQEVEDDDDDDIVDIYSKSHASITLAFEKLQADNRKTWLSKYDKKKIVEPIDHKLTFSDFIHGELIHYSNYSNLRTLPSMMDGQKPSQRKILYSCFKRNLYKEIKVAGLASYVVDDAEYHHGENSLQEATIGMAQNFVGSNNINLLKPCGNFGYRNEGGDNSASPRYIFTHLSSIVPYIFRKEDEPVLDYILEDGKFIEPESYAPIVPLILVNGAKGIGTGFSTTVPSFNINKIIDNLEKMLDQKEPDNLFPWYRGFTGKIESQKDKKGSLIDDKYRTSGIYEVINENTIRITELPIGTWTNNYCKFLDTCLVDPKTKKTSKTQFLQSYVKAPGNNVVDIEVVFWGSCLQDLLLKNTLETSLKLYGCLAVSNMYLYNEKGTVTKYDCVEDIFYEFYQFRTKIYAKRKAHVIKDLENQMNILKYKVKFIKQITSDELIVNKKKQDVLVKELENLKYPKFSTDSYAVEDKKDYKYLTSMAILSLTEEKMNELNDEFKKKEKEYNDYLNITVEELWRRELKELRAYYDKWLQECLEAEENNEKKNGKKEKKPKNVKGKSKTTVAKPAAGKTIKASK